MLLSRRNLVPLCLVALAKVSFQIKKSLFDQTDLVFSRGGALKRLASFLISLICSHVQLLHMVIVYHGEPYRAVRVQR